MAHNFRPYDQQQMLLMPPSVQDWVDARSLPRFISDVVDELDRSGGLAAFYARYRSDGWGRAAYSPVLMVKVFLYGYCLGVRSSRKLAHALEMDVGFRYLAGNQKPDFRTLSDFRKEHGEALSGLFVTSLQLCREAGLVKMGEVALDGRRVSGNAKLEANRTRKQLEELARRTLEEAQATDDAEDAQYGKDKRGDELPEALQTQEGRLKKIRAAIETLKEREAQARAEHEEHLEQRRQREEETGRRLTGTKPKFKQSKIDSAVVNLTDPESRTMKARKGWVQGYNGQTMVDCTSQVIVAQDLRQEGVDVHLLAPMLAQCETQAGRRPDLCIMDGGYWSEANAGLEGESLKLLIALGKTAEVTGAIAPIQRKTAPQSARANEMRARLASEEGRVLYKKRCHVESVFGQMYERGLNRILLRGLRKAKTEWALWCATHNFLKLWRSSWAAA